MSSSHQVPVLPERKDGGQKQVSLGEALTLAGALYAVC